MKTLHSIPRTPSRRMGSSARLALKSSRSTAVASEGNGGTLPPYEWPALLDHSKAPAFVHDGDFRILRCNKAYAAKAGIPIEQIVGQPYWQILPKLAHPPSPCEIDRPLEGGDAPAHSTDDGHFYADHEIPVPRPDGSFWYCRHLLEDVTARKKLEAELMREKAVSDAIIESAPNAFFLVDEDTKLVRWNSHLQQRLGLSAEQLRGSSVLNLVHEEDRTLMSAKLLTALATGAAQMEVRVDGDANGPSHFLTTTRRVYIDGAPHVAAFCTDITPRKRAEKALEEQKRFLDALVENIPGVFCVVDSEGSYLRWNSSLNKLTGLDNEALYKRSSLLTIAEPDRMQAAEKLQEVFEHGYAKAVLRVVSHDGGERAFLMTGRRFNIGGTPYVAGVGIDATEQLETIAALEREARTDGLTQIANRGHFLNRAVDEFARSRRYGHPLSAWALDLDHFKSVNDKYGHQAGDMVLRTFVATCRQMLRDWDILGRVGGEEFGVLLPETDAKQALLVAERLRQTVAATRIQVASDTLIAVTVSVGIATLREDDNDVHALLARADTALYNAKNTGRDKVSVA